MENVLTLIKAILKNSNKEKISNNKTFNMIYYCILILAILFIIISIEIMFYKYIGNQILIIAIVISNIFASIYGFKEIITDMYYGYYFKEFMILPIKSHELIIAKLFVISIKPILVTISIFGTTSLLVGISSRISFYYYILSMLGALIIPISNITIIIVVSCFFMKILNLKYIKKIKIFITSIPILSGIIIFSVIKFIGIEKIINFFLENKNILIKFIPSNLYLGNSFIEKDYLVESILISSGTILCVIVILKYISRIYLDIIYKNLEFKKTYNNSSYTKKSLLISLIRRDFKNIVRDPIFFSNILIRAFIMPITFILLLFLKNNKLENTVYLIMLFLIAKLNIISITAFSRERNELISLKVSPIENINIIIAKVMISIPINFILILFMAFTCGMFKNIAIIETIKLLSLIILFCIYGSLNSIFFSLNNLNIIPEEFNSNLNENIMKIIIRTIIEALIIFKFIKYINLLIGLAILTLIYFIKKSINLYKNIEIW